MVPIVSLAVPVHNGERYLPETLQSLLSQDFSDFEIIITDNASTDATAQISQALAARDSRIRYIRNSANIGAAGNFNLGFTLARGKYFKWCAHDDLLSPDFLTRCAEALGSDPTAILAHGRQQLIDEAGAHVPGITGGLSDTSDIHDPALRFRKVFSTQGYDAAMFGLFNRQALAKTSLHKPYYSSDIALLAECALLGRFLATSAVFYNREHSSRSVRITDKSERQFWHTGTRGTKPQCEHLHLLRHLIEMTMHARHDVPVHRTLPYVLAWASSPRQLARYALEVVAHISPGVSREMKRVGTAVTNRRAAAPAPLLGTSATTHRNRKA